MTEMFLYGFGVGMLVGAAVMGFAWFMAFRSGR